jgi:hypothetical protein
MNIETYLIKEFDQLSIKNISNENEFLTYDNFKKFIIEHYDLEHIEKYNYIKFVKIKRHILFLKEGEEYNFLLSEINNVIKIMSYNHIFPNLDIKKYLFKINSFFRLIELKKSNILNAITSIRNLFNLKNNNRIINAINTLNFRYQIFLKYSKRLIYFVNKLIFLESSYGIDHKLIELNNLERSFLGKKSEYIANKIMYDYTIHNKKYYYETNIDILKLLNIKIDHTDKLKGEVDGLIIYYDGIDYIIDKIIEVKSSIKATFEDTNKFIFLQKYIKEMNDNIEFKYNKYIFTKKSFINIINKDIDNWTIYICINTSCQDKVEKSYLYFCNVLKILDNDFIEDFYISKNDNIISQKYKLIENNRSNIDNLFNNWMDKIKFGTDKCNIYITKRY